MDRIWFHFRCPHKWDNIIQLPDDEELESFLSTYDTTKYVKKTGDLKQLSREENAERNLVELLKSKYNNVKKSFMEITEELKMRRLNDQVHEDKINKLITEKFELKRVKEEDVSILTKNLESLKQDKMQLEKDLNEKTALHEEEKNTHNISLNSSSKGVKTLKDEILALQLVKYSLEKKIKEQDHQIQLERSSNEEMNNHLSDCQAATESARKQFLEVDRRVKQLSDIVSKTEDVHSKLILVNQHHKCVVENYKDETTNLNQELTSIKAEYALLKDQLNKKENGSNRSHEDHRGFPQDDRLEEMERSFDQLQKEIETVRTEKKNLLVSLSDSTELYAFLKLKYGDVIKSNELFQLELDEVKTEMSGSKKENNALKSEIDILKKKIEEEETTNSDLEAHYKVKIQILEEALNSLRVENETQLQENSKYLTRLTELKRQNENVMNLSRSSQTECLGDVTLQQQDREIVSSNKSINETSCDVVIPGDEKEEVGNKVDSISKETGSEGVACELQNADQLSVDATDGGSGSKAEVLNKDKDEAGKSTLVKDVNSSIAQQLADLRKTSSEDGSQQVSKRRIEDVIYDGNVPKQRKVEILSSTNIDSQEELRPIKDSPKSLDLDKSILVGSDTIMSSQKDVSTPSSSQVKDGTPSSVPVLEKRATLCNRVSFAENTLLIIDANPENCREVDSTLNSANSILKKT